MARQVPDGREVESVFIAHLGAFGKRAAHEGMVAVAVEALDGYERQRLGGGEAEAVDGGYAAAVARGCLSGESPLG